MPSVRMQRVHELLKRALSEILRQAMPISEMGIASVNDLEVANDTQTATVYVGLIGTPEQQKRAMAFLQTETGHIQSQLAKKVVLRYTPKLRFIRDDSIERGNRVLAIMEEIEKPPPKP